METGLEKYEEGQVLLVDKPLRWTSFDVVRKIRNLVRTRKVGHAGTLDPLATGLLIVCTGRFTKRINEYMAREKEYTGTIVLGFTTPTYDLESQPENEKDVSAITGDQVREAAAALTGEIWQVPPQHSAIKKDGKRVYELARKGQTVELEPRKIFIGAFDITAIEGRVITFRVRCSTGTYIRSLANDIGSRLGCGAYLGSLCRTAIGEFRVEDAWSMEAFEKRIQEEKAATKTDS